MECGIQTKGPGTKSGPSLLHLSSYYITNSDNVPDRGYPPPYGGRASRQGISGFQPRCATLSYTGSQAVLLT